MELAIPLVALGGLYVISNQKKEGFKPVNQYSSPNQTTDKFFKPSKEEEWFWIVSNFKNRSCTFV